MNNENSHHKTYIDLLKDKTFIRWRIAPSEEIENYWNDIISRKPHLEKEVLKADNYLRTHLLKEEEFTNSDKSILLNNIIISMSKKRQKRPLFFRSISSIAAACIVLFMIGGLYWYVYKTQNSSPSIIAKGSTLAPESIQLIAGSSITSFNRNIEIKIDEGVAHINAGREDEEKINIHTNSTFNKLMVPYGKRSSITLPDGTKVWVNSGSVLEFPSKFTGSKREIWVTGEIFAEVTSDKQKPFYVHTRDFNVRVYGTKFNVLSDTELQSNVVLVEGSVELTAGNKKLFLAPHEMGELKPSGDFSKKSIDPQEYISWKEGYLKLNKMPILEVLQRIGRYYNVKFDVDDNLEIPNIKCSGKLDLSDNFDDVMNAIAIISQTNYVRNGNIIYINKRTK